MVPSLNTNTPVDTSDSATKGIAAPTSYSTTPGTSPENYVDERRELDEAYLLRLAQESESQSSTFMMMGVRSHWARSYKAYRNQHADNSKYYDPAYKGRSKYFRPKTRMAVKKKMAAAAQALFGSGSVVAISAQNEADDYQKASAAIKQELINYRLKRTSRRNGVRWFMIASGAVQTAQLTGLVISKQSWRYREDDPRAFADGANPAAQRMGQPAVLEDKPNIELIPPENVLFDPNCDWTDPAQSSAYLQIRWPMSVDEAHTMIKQQISTGNAAFLDISRETLASHIQTSGPIDTMATRTARNAGKDPTQQVSGHFGRVWLYEIYMRIGNLDVTYWTLSNKIMISKAVPVRRAHPWNGGERPIAIGYGELEAFRPYPMSPVESLQGLQMEINDQANLRLDHMKQVVSPPAKVKRGKKVDLTALQRRGPNTTILLNDMDDVEWWQQPDVPPSAYQENNLTSNDFDTLAGVFDSGSVANNREMNETVGGMKLLAAASNPLVDFDLNVFVETWAEPVLWQLMKLEEHYESDATVLALCGEKARLFERFGISEITDELLTRETTLTINLGIGSANLPEDKIKRFAGASQVVGQFLLPFVQSGRAVLPTPRVKEVVDTVFGAAGFTDGGERFFGPLDDSGNPPPPPPPDQGPALQAQARMAQVQAQREKTQIDAQMKLAELDQKRQEKIAAVEQEHIRALAEIGRALLEGRHAAATQAREHAHHDINAHLERQHGMMRDQINAEARAAQAHAAGKGAMQ